MLCADNILIQFIEAKSMLTTGYGKLSSDEINVIYWWT